MSVPTKQQIESLTQRLMPDMHDFIDNKTYEYWLNYSFALDEFSLVTRFDEDIVVWLNKRMGKEFSTSPEHHAATDIAITLESMYNSFRGKFKYN